MLGGCRKEEGGRNEGEEGRVRKERRVEKYDRAEEEEEEGKAWVVYALELKYLSVSAQKLRIWFSSTICS